MPLSQVVELGRDLLCIALLLGLSAVCFNLPGLWQNDTPSNL